MNKPQRAEPKPDHTGNSPVVVKTDLRTAESLETLITDVMFESLNTVFI